MVGVCFSWCFLAAKTAGKMFVQTLHCSSMFGDNDHLQMRSYSLRWNATHSNYLKIRQQWFFTFFDVSIKKTWIFFSKDLFDPHIFFQPGNPCWKFMATGIPHLLHHFPTISMALKWMIFHLQRSHSWLENRPFLMVFCQGERKNMGIFLALWCWFTGRVNGNKTNPVLKITFWILRNIVTSHMSVLGGGNSNIFLFSSLPGVSWSNLTCTHSFQMGWWKTTNLRLFQHTFGTHPEQPLPIGCKGNPFYSWPRGFAWGVLYGCVVIFLEWKTHPTRWPWGYICFPRFFPPRCVKNTKRNHRRWVDWQGFPKK